MHFWGALHPDGPGRLAGTLDLRAISLVEGVRAGLAAALPVLLATWLHRPELNYAALAALLTCICDPAGPIQLRLPVLAGFVLSGAAALGGFGLLRVHGIWPVLGVAGPALFACAMLRIWGTGAQAVGNLLGVVVLLGCDLPLSPAAAGWRSAAFLAGGFWAVLLTLVIWRIHPFGPARRAVADIWAGLAAHARALTRLVAEDAPRAEWEAQTRLRRAAIRSTIEAARGVLMQSTALRGPASAPAAQNLLRLEAADQVFAAQIGLEAALEMAPPACRAGAIPLLRRLRPMLSLMVRAVETDRLERFVRFEQAVAALAAEPGLDPALAPYARVLAERLTLASKFVDPTQYLPGSRQQGGGLTLRNRLWGPLSANLNWQSDGLRHSARVAAVVVPALAATLIWHGPYTHWLTITMMLVMQPNFAQTWERTLARSAGTLAGGLTVAVMSLLIQSRAHLAGLLPVLGALALAVRQVSYGAYIAVYTPTVILLVEGLSPSANPLLVALARAKLTVLGGLIAVAANAVLWPAWEPDALRRHLQAALRAHAAFAAAVLGPPAGAAGAGAKDRARRAAGLASNNLEASLARAMQEPARGQRDMVQTVMAAAAALRRIAGRLTALGLHTAPAGDPWPAAALQALADGAPPPARPAGLGVDMAERLARQVAALAEILARLDVRE